MNKFYYIVTSLNAFDESYLPAKSWPHTRYKTRQEARNAKKLVPAKYLKAPARIVQIDASTFKPIKFVR